MAPKKKKYSELSASGKYYRKNKAARDKKKKTDSEVNKRPEQKKKRREAGKKRYAAKKAGKNVNGKDYDHATNKFVSSKTNRGRKGEGGRKKKK
jgi:hypothetical protein